jgi:hypothetical protein
MSRHNSGNYRAKHPPDIRVDEVIMNQVTVKMVEGSLTCQSAHTIASTLAVPPNQVGVAIDLQNGRIKACQLGLFGYGKVKSIAQAGSEIKEELKTAIESALVDGRLSCAAAWGIADAVGVSRLEIGRACEMLGVKINQCQLGAF